MKSVPFFNYPDLYSKDRENFQKIFDDVCSRGAFILQKELSDFESELKSYVGASYAYGVSDGTNAMILGLKAAGIGDGDKIIMSSHTYIATAAAVKLVGATPVFADIGHDNLICAKSVEKMSEKGATAVMVTQLNGRCCDMDGIQAVCHKYGLTLFEDSAQALGAKFKGRAAGTFGAFGTYSFYPAKILGCFGDGGALITDEKKIANDVAMRRDHGRTESGEIGLWGTNSRLDNLQAAFLLFKLKKLDLSIKRRREIAAIYDRRLKDISEIILPPGPNDDDHHFDVFQNYEIAANDRDKLKSFLHSKGVGTLIQWGGKAVHQLKNLDFECSESFELERTEIFFTKCIMLPMNETLTDHEVCYISNLICLFYGYKPEVAHE